MVEISKSLGAVTVILVVNREPETVNVCSADTAPVQEEKLVSAVALTETEGPIKRPV